MSCYRFSGFIIDQNQKSIIALMDYQEFLINKDSNVNKITY